MRCIRASELVDRAAIWLKWTVGVPKHLWPVQPQDQYDLGVQYQIFVEYRSFSD